MRLSSFYRKISLKQWLLIALFFLLVNVIISIQLYLTALKNDLPISWVNVFYNEMPLWLPWIAITPLVLYLNFQFPLNRSYRLGKHMTLHLVSGFFLIFIISNITLLYKFWLHGYVKLEELNFQKYFPYLGYRFFSDLLIYIFLTIVCLVLKIYSDHQQKVVEALEVSLRNNQLKNQLTQAQLQALKLQLNPHFLFNTLNTISSLTITNQKNNSVDVTNNLAAFLRRTLAFEQEQLVPLYKEIEFFDLYLQIEKARFPNRLHIQKEIEKECLSLPIPNLILQPLVENAIKHGIARSKNASKIELKISKMHKWLLIQLWNEGKTLALDWENKINIGLANTLERLNKIYGDHYTFNLVNRNDKPGVVAVLRLPLQKGSSILIHSTDRRINKNSL